jgi:probable F420-dependent oxidoreductase
LRFWLSLNFEPWDQILDLARTAEALGFEGVVLPDHIVVPAGDTTPHPSGYPLQPDEAFLDPLVAFAAMSSVTTRLRFLSGVLVVPLRDPFLLAKQLGTLALLSGNRVVLGTGTGWLKDEFDVVGQGWHDRGGRMDEALDLMVDFWHDGWAERHGEHFDLPRSGMFPAPSKPIPIWIGGHSRPAMRRAARFDGYLPMRPFDDVSRAEFAEVERRRREQGLTGSFERVAYWPGGDRSTADELAELDGINSVIVFAWEPYSPMMIAEKQATAETFEPYSPITLEEKRAAAEEFAAKVICG